MTKKYIPELPTFRAGLFLILLLLLTTCGGYDPDSTGGTGSLAFKIDWQNAPTLSPTLEKGGEEVFPLNKGGQGVVNGDGISYAPIDCTASGVSTVSATVYTSTGSSLATGGPWNCSDHAGNITGVPAGTSRKLVVHGKDSSGNIKYSGEQTGITVEDGKTSSEVTITLTYFAPTGVSATAGNKQVTISWSSVSGATSYNIYWSTTSGVTKTTGTKITGTTTTSYTHTGRTNDTTYYYVVTAVNSYRESSESSQVSATPTNAISAPDLGDAVDNTSLSWITGGYAYWFKQSVAYYSGGYAAQSGYIGNSENTYIQTTVTGPGTLKFYWKVSSESYDYLKFYINGAEQTSISGYATWDTDTYWTQKIYAIPSGSHTLKWAYTTDSSGVYGSNAGWLDKVEFTPQ